MALGYLTTPGVAALGATKGGSSRASFAAFRSDIVCTVIIEKLSSPSAIERKSTETQARLAHFGRNPFAPAYVASNGELPRGQLTRRFKRRRFCGRLNSLIIDKGGPAVFSL